MAANLALLRTLGLHGMAKGLESVWEGSPADDSGRMEWLALLLEQESELREKKRLQRRLRKANLAQAASVDNVDRLVVRGLDSTLFCALTDGEWIRARRNVLIAGTTGVGKTWLACALGRKALIDGFTVSYYRASRLFDAIKSARGQGGYDRVMRAIARLDVLIVDDWGFQRLDADERHDLLEIVEDRYESRSTVVVSHLPIERWYSVIGDPSIAVPIFDRLAHNSHRIELKGESLRKLS
jgi:DNA replication protein DnaC